MDKRDWVGDVTDVVLLSVGMGASVLYAFTGEQACANAAIFGFLAFNALTIKRIEDWLADKAKANGQD